MVLPSAALTLRKRAPTRPCQSSRPAAAQPTVGVEDPLYDIAALSTGSREGLGVSGSIKPDHKELV